MDINMSAISTDFPNTLITVPRMARHVTLSSVLQRGRSDRSSRAPHAVMRHPLASLQEWVSFQGRRIQSSLLIIDLHQGEIWNKHQRLIQCLLKHLPPPPPLPIRRDRSEMPFLRRHPSELRDPSRPARTM